MSPNTITQEAMIHTPAAVVAVNDPISLYYCASVAVIISVALLVKLFRWWKK